MQKRKSKILSQKKSTFHINLTQYQASFLSNLLPQKYSILSVSIQNKKQKQHIKNNKQFKQQNTTQTIVQQDPKSNISLQKSLRSLYQSQISQDYKLKFKLSFQILDIILQHPKHTVLCNMTSSKLNFYPPTVKRKIKQINLQTIQKKITKQAYKDLSQFYRDINRMFLTGYTKYKKHQQAYSVVQEIQVQILIHTQNNLPPQPSQNLQSDVEEKNQISQQIKKQKSTTNLFQQIKSQLSQVLKKMSQIKLKNQKEQAPRKLKKKKKQSHSFNMSQRRQLAKMSKECQGIQIKHLSQILTEQRIIPNELTIDFQKIQNRILKRVKLYMNKIEKVPQLKNSVSKKSFQMMSYQEAQYQDSEQILLLDE